MAFSVARLKHSSQSRSIPAQAFTLIELLIVVAIVALLAAIAVPNFLEAQTRAKVSRAVSDLRTLATALETYRIDHQAYPPNDGYYNVIPRQVTTPVAYLAGSKMIDPFCDKGWDREYGELVRYYTYGKVVDKAGFERDSQDGHAPAIEVADMPGFNWGAQTKYGPWRLVSNGPDRVYSSPLFLASDPILQGADIAYDPTNGTVSWGNLLRTQRSSLGQVKP